MRILFDLDHTLADSTHRERFVDGSLGYEHWDGFYSEEQVLLDAGIKPMVALCDSLWRRIGAGAPEHQIKFLTGRDERARAPTVKWLRTQMHLGPFFTERNSDEWLLMRALDDRRQNSDYKAAQIDRLISDGWTPDMVFDDEESLAPVLAERRITFLQVRAPR